MLYRIKQNSANHGTYSAFIKTSNLHLYHYAGNNPVKYIDPDGRIILNCNVWYANDFMQMYDCTWPDSTETIARSGCTLIAANRAANVAIYFFGYAMETAKPSTIFMMLNEPSLTCSNGIIFSGLKYYLENFGVEATIIDTGKEGKDISAYLQDAKFSEESYLVIGRIPGDKEDHFVNINSYDPYAKTVNATDTSLSDSGEKERRNLNSVPVQTFDRLILIKVKSIEDN